MSSRVEKTKWRQIPYVVRHAERQPEVGDTVMMCQHTGAHRWHWFRYGTPVEFKRPDGTQGRSRWLCVCEACLAEFPEPQKAISRDMVWAEDSPVILKGVQ